MMLDIPVPPTRKAQVARKEIIHFVKAYQEESRGVQEVLCALFQAFKDDPLLESSFNDIAIKFVNDEYDNPLFEKKFEEFAQVLLTLPIVDEEANPYYFCSTHDEKVDQQILLELKQAYPELLEDKYYLNLLELFPCAHLCYSEFASKVSKAIEALPDNSNISSSSYFLREAFQFIEKILLLDGLVCGKVQELGF
ncbi:MAG: hypothetical protein K0M45_03990 [Candidatus Paracaedibacteraceae bacterium]|nr:hypothetical protein [Candidatus Paracaedibacteraceae bacterium]